MIFSRILLFSTLSVFTAHGQIQLLTGSPTPMSLNRYPSAIYGITEAGDVKLVSEVVPAGLGTVWIGYSYEWKKAVLLTASPGERIFVLDLRTGLLEKQCIDPPPLRDETVVEQWMLDSPATGPTIAELLSGGNPHLAYARGMTLDAKSPATPASQASGLWI